MTFTLETQSSFPARPTLTIVFLCALAFWIGCASLYGIFAVQGMQACALLALGSAVVAVLFAFLLVPKKTRAVGCLFLSLAVGAFLGAAHGYAVHGASAVWHEACNEQITLILLEDSRSNEFGDTALIEAHAEQFGTAVFEARVSGDTQMYCGERYSARASYKLIDYSQDERAWQRGACGVLSLNELQRFDEALPVTLVISLRKRVIEAIGSQDEQHGLLQALVCGYRREIEESSVYTCFQSCGLAHLVSVSGAHLVIVTGLAATCAEAARIPRRLTIGLLVAVMVFYFILAGMPVSALRACIMSTLCLVSFFGKRRPSSLNAVGLGLFAIIAHAPASSVSPSLALSVLSTIGIVVFAPLVSHWIGHTPLGRLSVVSDALSLTISAGLLSQLYASSLFFQLSIVSPFANIACAPLFPLVCGTGLISGLFQTFPSDVFSITICVPSAVSGILISLVTCFANLPFASIPFSIDTKVALIISGFLAISLWAWWPRPNAKVAIGTLLAVLLIVQLPIALNDDSDKIVMLDIGQGDSMLITSGGCSLLIDTGNQDAKLLQQLAAQHVIHIDTVLITHADDDHCGSLDALQKAVDVDRIIVAHDMVSCDDESAQELIEECLRTAPELVEVSYGDSFSVGAFTLEVVWPIAFTDKGGNADSLCTVVSYDADLDGEFDMRILTTGDAEEDEMQSMIDRGSVGDIDILKVGHHGSRKSLTDDEAAILKPEISIISCGAHNRYGHPAPELLDTLDSIGSKILRTDVNGAITCVFSPSGVSVCCERQPGY